MYIAQFFFTFKHHFIKAASFSQWPLRNSLSTLSMKNITTKTVIMKKKYLEHFLRYRKRQSRKKRKNALILEAQQLIREIQSGEDRKKKPKKLGKRLLKRGAIGPENTSSPNAPPPKKEENG